MSAKVVLICIIQFIVTSYSHKKEYYCVFSAKRAHLNGFYQRVDKHMYQHIHTALPRQLRFSTPKPTSDATASYNWSIICRDDVQHSGITKESRDIIMPGLIVKYVEMPKVDLPTILMKISGVFTEIIYVHLRDEDYTQLTQHESALQKELVNSTAIIDDLSKLNQALKTTLTKYKQDLQDSSAIINELQLNLARYSTMYIVIIVIVSFICMLSTIMWYRNTHNAKIYHLQQMRRCVNHRIPSPQNIVKAKGKVKNEGNETMGHWQPEKFSDMLGNSQVVQDMIVNDIVNDMQTEGHNNDNIPDSIDKVLDGVEQETTIS